MGSSKQSSNSGLVIGNGDGQNSASHNIQMIRVAPQVSAQDSERANAVIMQLKLKLGSVIDEVLQDLVQTQ